MDQTNQLWIYARDHLAGSVAAIGLLDGLVRKFHNTRLGIFAAELRDEIERDQQNLLQLIEELGGRSRTTEALAWAAEKIGRIKLIHSNGELATLESLEALSLGIMGKRALWRSLSQIDDDERLRKYDFGDLIRRAEEQYEKVETVRLEKARAALSSAPAAAAAA